MADMPVGNSIALDETDRLISADKVEGTSVYNRQGDKLGSIYTVMIDKISGKVAYAVMSFGGFLGIGDRFHPMPWGILTYDTAQGGYVVDMSKEALEAAPSYAASDVPRWGDRAWGQSIYDYYQMPPYWI